MHVTGDDGRIALSLGDHEFVLTEPGGVTAARELVSDLESLVETAFGSRRSK